MTLNLTVPIKTLADREYIQRLDMWCNQQGIMLIVGFRQHDATLSFNGEGQAMIDLSTYLQRR